VFNPDIAVAFADASFSTSDRLDCKELMSDACEVIDPSALVTRVSIPLMAVALALTLLFVVKRLDCSDVISDD
jgi:hypothetical protein